MLFFDGSEEAANIADAALQRMKAGRLVPTPDNYTIWYAYYSGQFPDLIQAIDGLTRSGLPLDDQRCAELHQRFFGVERERVALRLAGDRLSEALDLAVRLLADAGADVSRYGEVLAATRKGLTLTATLEQLQALVRTVADETTRIAERNRLLQNQLGATTHTIEEMQRDLDAFRLESLTDALTGIGNRKRFDQELIDRMRTARAAATPLSLLMVDIDHFKRFNDTYGHVSGDQVLKLVARTLTDNVPEAATPARYGGEEFGVILPGLPLADATRVGERIRSCVASRQIVKRTTGESMGSITLSVGVAQFRQGEDPVTLIKRADSALYRAKSGGRNRVAQEVD